MQKIKDYIISHKYFLVFLIFFVIMLPLTVSLPAQTDTRSIVTGVSIDKKDDKYSVGLQIISPQSNISNNENLQIVEDEGESFYNCIANLSIKLGKLIGFEHANIIILGESMADEDIMNILDFLYRNYKITMSAILVQCKGEAKILLETSAELNNNSSSSLQNNLGFNNLIIETANTTTLGNFFNDYYSFSGTSLMSVIETPQKEGEKKNTSNSNGSSGGSSGGQNQQGSEGSSGSGGAGAESPVEPLVKNNGEGAVYKNGKLIEIISRDLTKGFTWPQEKTVQGIIKIEDITDNRYYNHSTVTVKIEQSKTKVSSMIKNDEMILDVKLKLYCYVAEIVDNSKKSLNVVQLNEDYLSAPLVEKVNEKISILVSDSLNYSKQKKVDVFKFYDRFYKFNNKEFKKFLNKFGEDYLEHCQINLNIEVFQYK